MSKSSSGLINEIQVGDLEKKINSGETFVINIVTDWCPDCSLRQRPHLPAFIEKLETAGIHFFQMSVQREQLVFISDGHQQITNKFGGHGYPRTALVLKGTIQEDSKVEIITPEGLEELAAEFSERVRQKI